MPRHHHHNYNHSQQFPQNPVAPNLYQKPNRHYPQVYAADPKYPSYPFSYAPAQMWAQSHIKQVNKASQMEKRGGYPLSSYQPRNAQ